MSGILQIRSSLIPEQKNCTDKICSLTRGPCFRSLIFLKFGRCFLEFIFLGEIRRLSGFISHKSPIPWNSEFNFALFSILLYLRWNIWTENSRTHEAYFSCPEGLNAQTNIHTNTHTWIQNTYVCAHYSLKARCNRRKHTLRGPYIRCHLVRPSAGRGLHVKMSSRAHGGPTYDDVSISWLEKPFVKCAMGAVYEILNWREVKFISAKPADVSINA